MRHETEPVCCLRQLDIATGSLSRNHLKLHPYQIRHPARASRSKSKSGSAQIARSTRFDFGFDEVLGPVRWNGSFVDPGGAISPPVWLIDPQDQPGGRRTEANERTVRPKTAAVPESLVLVFSLAGRGVGGTDVAFERQEAARHHAG